MPVSTALSIRTNPLPARHSGDFMTKITHTLPRRPKKGSTSFRRMPEPCAREGAQTAWWKSVPGQAMTPKLKVTASSRGGVGSNRKRTGSPQDDELDSAGYDDEPAHSWRSPEIAQHAGNGGESDAGAHFVVGGGMLGSLCDISGETCCRGDGSRSQNLRCTARLWSGPRPNGWGNWRHAWRASLVPKPCEATGKARLAKPCRGKEGRKVDARNLEEARGNEVTTVLETAKQVTAIDGWGSQTWIDRGIWTD